MLKPMHVAQLMSHRAMEGFSRTSIIHPFVVEGPTESGVERDVGLDDPTAAVVAQKSCCQGRGSPGRAINAFEIGRTRPAGQIETTVAPTVGVGWRDIDPENVRGIVIPFGHLIFVFR